MNLFVLAAIAFVAGCASVGIAWGVASAAGDKRRRDAETARNDVAGEIGALCGDVDNAFSSFRIGNLDPNALKVSASAKLETIQKLLRENMHRLDQFHTRYLERYVDDCWQKLVETASPGAVSHGSGEVLVARETRWIPEVKGGAPLVAPAEADEPEAPAGDVREAVLPPMPIMPQAVGVADGAAGGAVPAPEEAVAPLAAAFEEDEPHDQVLLTEALEAGSMDAFSEDLCEPELSFDEAEESEGIATQSWPLPVAEEPALAPEATSKTAQEPPAVPPPPPPLAPLEFTISPPAFERGEETDQVEPFAPVPALEEPSGDVGDGAPESGFPVVESVAGPVEAEPLLPPPPVLPPPPSVEVKSNERGDLPAEDVLALSGGDDLGEASFFDAAETDDAGFSFDMAAEDAFTTQDETMVIDSEAPKSSGPEVGPVDEEKHKVHISPPGGDFVSGETQIFDRASLADLRQKVRDDFVFDDAEPEAEEPAATEEEPWLEPAGSTPAELPEPEGAVTSAAPKAPKDDAMAKQADDDDSLITGDDIMKKMDSFFGFE